MIKRTNATRAAFLSFAALTLIALGKRSDAQEKITLSYASVGATNAIWNIAKELGFYKKHGLDADVIYIGSTTVSTAAIMAEDVPVGMAGGSGIANVAVRGGDLLSAACFVNTLDFDLVVLPSIQSPEALKGKTIGISRFGSVSDVAARELVKALGLRPVDDVGIRQVGGAPERAAAFSGGAIAGFLSPPGSIYLLKKAIPHRVLARTAELRNPPPFPWVCVATSKRYLAKKRDTVKRVVMALIEATYYFKTNKEDTQKIMARYHPAANKPYLDDAYRSTAKILERVPYVTREGMTIQLEEARKNNPGSKATVDDLIDDRMVQEIEREGFIDRVYGR